MSKRKQVAQGPPATGSTEVGKLLSELFDPRYQAFMQMEASESDVLEFLEASRQLFAYKPNKKAKTFLEMPIDTPGAAKHFTEALINKIDEIKQEGNPANDPVQSHRLQLARLIDDALTAITSKAILMEWTNKIWAEANKHTRAARSRDGGIRFDSETPKKQDWTRMAIARVRQNEPNISKSDFARRLYAMARKEHLDWWDGANSVRRWLYGHKFL